MSGVSKRCSHGYSIYAWYKYVYISQRFDVCSMPISFVKCGDRMSDYDVLIVLCRFGCGA